MTIRRLPSAIIAGVLACGLVAITPASGSAQERERKGLARGPSFLPAEGGPITVYGCFQRIKVGKEGRKFVLSAPQPGPATSVTERSCTATANEEMIELDDVHSNVHKHHLDQAKVGQYIEVTGRLEKPGHQTLREVHVENYRIVPVVPPAVVADATLAATPFESRPIPKTEPAPAPIEAAPVPTTGGDELPKTASSLPLTALLGFLALAGGLALRLIAKPTL